MPPDVGIGASGNASALQRLGPLSDQLWSCQRHRRHGSSWSNSTVGVRSIVSGRSTTPS